MEKRFITENKSFMVYKEWEDLVSELDDEKAGKLFKAMFAYTRRGEEPKLDTVTRLIFKVLKAQFDRDGEKWEKRCEQNRENAKKRWDTNPDDSEQTHTLAYDRIQTYANYADKDKDKEKEKEKDDDIDKEKDKEAPPAGKKAGKSRKNKNKKSDDSWQNGQTPLGPPPLDEAFLQEIEKCLRKC